MEEEELCAGPAGALSQIMVVVPAFLYHGWRWHLGAGAVEVEDACGVHDEGRPAEKLVRPNACRSCTSRSALQARWNKRVILVYSL